MNDKKEKSKIGKIVAKVLLTIIVLIISFYIGLYSILICMGEGLNVFLTYSSAIIFPWLCLLLIYSKNRKKAFKIWLLFVLIFFIIFGIEFAIEKYNESITINTNVNIITHEYLPFDDNSKIVKLDRESDLKLTENLPILDGAAAVFPVYSSFVNAVYPSNVTLKNSYTGNPGVFQYNNTKIGYELLAEKKTDIFFGAYPSKEQIEYAQKNDTEFRYTEIGKEAFVFFVHKDNPVDNLTTQQIKDIYSGKITNWKEVGGKNEKIVAFQRNKGSGSQSMLLRFMGETPVMEAPSEQVNDFMSGIIDKVSDYKNKTSSIGFSFRYYMEGIIKNPNVKMLSIDGVEPNAQNIRANEYSITTPLYAVTYENNENENVEKLINWILSKDGQEIIEKTGYVGIRNEE